MDTRRYHMRAFLALILPLSLVVGCKDDPPQAPAENSLKLLSFQEVTSVSWEAVLRLDWEAQLDASSDSIVIEAVRLDSTQQAQRIHVMPGAGGHYEIAARTITFPAFRFRLRTMESGIIVESAAITFREIKPGITILYPVNEMPIHSDESIRVAWSTTGLPDSTSLTLSIRGEETESWVVLRNYTLSITEAILPVQSIQRESFVFRVAAADGSVFAVTPRIHVVPDTINAPIIVLNPRAGDTLVFHQDVLHWIPAPGMSKKITSIAISTHDSQVLSSDGGEYPSNRTSIALSEILKDPPHEQGSRWKYTFHIKVLPGGEIVTIGPVTIFDFRFEKGLDNEVLRRGTRLDIPTYHTAFGEKNFHGLNGGEFGPLVAFLFSSDGGNSWREENQFATRKKHMPLSIAASENCFLMMRGPIGSRFFADTTGPFRIIDNTTPLFTWNTGDVLRYVRTQDRMPSDTLTVSFIARTETSDLIQYSVEEHSSVSGERTKHTITEEKHNMHRLSGWRIPHTDIYRYADRDISSISSYWLHIFHWIEVTLTRDVGIDVIEERTHPTNPSIVIRTSIIR